jgi:hypothetical protein
MSIPPMHSASATPSPPDRGSAPPAQAESPRADLRAAIALAVLAATAVVTVSVLLHEPLWAKVVRDQWFSADTTRVLEDMFVRDGNHYRTKVHPLFVAFTMPMGLLLTNVVGMSQAVASITFSAAVAAVWAGVLFATLRAMRLTRVDSVLFTAVGLTSSASMFWLIVPETYALGSLSLMLPAWLVASAASARISAVKLCAASGFSLSMTVTNWMSGVLATVLLRPPLRAALLILVTVVTVTVAWFVQRAIWPSTGGHFLHKQDAESEFLFLPILGGPLGALRGMLAHGIVMPEVQAFGQSRLTVQHSGLFGSVLQSAGVTVWFVLLAIGIRQLLLGSAWPRLRLFLCGLAAGQLLLHTVYGDENFLYSMHTTLPLILIAALAAEARPRLVRPLCGVLIVLLVCNNASRLLDAVNFPLPR